jgi:hypothetical protein
MTEAEQQKVFAAHLRQVRKRVASRDGSREATLFSLHAGKATRKRMRRRAPSERTLIFTSYKRFLETLR